VPSGSQTRNNRDSAGLDTMAQRTWVREHATLIRCSAEKPAVPMNSRPRRSKITRLERMMLRCTYAASWSALAASSSPSTVITVPARLWRAPNWAVRLSCQDWATDMLDSIIGRIVLSMTPGER
jgi:hypothetical protein